eukprot:2409519-Rhodomonas_salina.1
MQKFTPRYASSRDFGVLCVDFGGYLDRDGSTCGSAAARLPRRAYPPGSSVREVSTGHAVAGA